ncbi:MAG: hypothetical protein KGJ88_05715 [Verrucomicrobiota bacterium]|nr:hypothetical protein [Verrucomicrobiota bacterium]
MRVVRQPEVPLELEAAARWYEERQARGLRAGTFWRNIRPRCAASWTGRTRSIGGR